MVNAYTNGTIGHAGIALAFAFVVTAMIFAVGHLSGAHLNPAVTAGFWAAGRMRARDVGPYVLSQLTGAVAASAALSVIVGTAGNSGATIPAISTGAAFGIEWLMSFVLMFVIMAVATDARVPAGFGAIAVGMTVGFCAMMGGPLTGASMNPARSFGPALIGSHWASHWLYWLAPISAMLVAARTYAFVRSVSPPISPADKEV